MIKPLAQDFADLSFLVVDDETFVCDLTVTMLQGLGATNVFSAENGVEVLEVLDGDAPHPDVMLIDLRMPEMGGVHLMRELAQRRYRGGVILVSGVDEETLDVAQALAKTRNINVLGAVNKPITQAAVKAALANLG